MKNRRDNQENNQRADRVFAPRGFTSLPSNYFSIRGPVHMAEQMSTHENKTNVFKRFLTPEGQFQHFASQLTFHL